jgi:hypothetical protein
MRAASSGRWQGNAGPIGCLERDQRFLGGLGVDGPVDGLQG